MEFLFLGINQDIYFVVLTFDHVVTFFVVAILANSCLLIFICKIT